MCLVKKTPKASLMVVYYAKLTEIFWTSSSHLYHAYAWLKLFTLQKSFNKNLSQRDLQLIASSVVLAALSVPPYDCSQGASHLELENEKERNLKVASLIGFDVEPKSENREVVNQFYVLFLPFPIMYFFALSESFYVLLIMTSIHFQLSRSGLLAELVCSILYLFSDFSEILCNE